MSEEQRGPRPPTRPIMESIPAAPKTEAPRNDGQTFYTVDLPSKGVFGYPSTVEYRDILVRDEKILSTATKANYIQTLNKILKSLLGDPEFYDKLVVYDRDFLLLWIWANNYSPIKKVGVTCINCDHEDEVEIDLTKLDVKDVDPELTVPFILETGDGQSLKLKMVTVGDQLATLAYIKEHPEYDEDTVLYSLTIDTGTVMPLDRKVRWIEDNVKGKTMAMVRAFHDHFRYGVNDRLEHTCSVCQEVTHYRLPFRPEWLRPTVQDDFEKMLRANRQTQNQSD